MRRSLRPLAGAGLAAALLAAPAAAQSLGDAERRALLDRVERLSSEIAGIRARLGGGGGGGGPAGLGGQVMVRLDRIEVEISRLTGRIEELAHRQRRIAEDGARRIGGLDLRVTELEGGDIAALAPQPPLGAAPGESGAAPAGTDGAGAEESGAGADEPGADGNTPGTGDAGGSRGAPRIPGLVPGEDPLLALAVDDVRQGRFDQGEERLDRVLASAPDAREAARAHFWLGKSRFTRGRHGAAARSFLAAYNSARSGPLAPEALLQLGITLGRLGQTSEACLTLREVRNRFPDRDRGVLEAADSEADALACGS